MSFILTSVIFHLSNAANFDLLLNLGNEFKS